MIYASHGVVENYSSEQFCHRNLLDKAKFEHYLKHRKEKFVNLGEALLGNGDAFTIDDATCGAFLAAELLNYYEHEVTLFINPYHVEHKLPYWFLILNYILDYKVPDSICYQRENYSLKTYKNKKEFRKVLKNELSHWAGECERRHFLQEFFGIDLNTIELPSYLNTLNENQIVQLHEMGIDIQNHGWTHRQLLNCSLGEVQNEVLKGQNWIEKKIQKTASFYAVPFGDCRPPQTTVTLPAEAWFLLDGSMPSGFVMKENTEPENLKVYNRLDFDNDFFEETLGF